ANLEVLGRQVADAERIVLSRIVRASGVDDHQCPIPFHVCDGASDAIVAAASAQATFPAAAALPGNHFSILDPASPGNRTAEVVRHHVLTDVTPRPASATEPGSGTPTAGQPDDR